MITAKEAIQIAGPTIPEMAEFFDPHIRNAAGQKQREVTVFHGSLEYEAYSNTEYWKKFEQYMKNLGFDVSLFYKESQFVDMRITIKW